MITIELLREICPDTRVPVLTAYISPLNEVITYYEMTSTNRLAGFLSQIAVESGCFNFVKENLNYSAQGLRTTFKKYFPTDEMAAEYARQPEKIANKVYANRMGNGPAESGDGFKFRGRGLIQLTGRNNYTAFAEALDMSLDDTVSYLETAAGACASAGWFWDINKLNVYCDSNDIIGLTKRINGGTHGLSERLLKYQKASTMLLTQ